MKKIVLAMMAVLLAFSEAGFQSFPFVGEFEECVDALQEAGAPVEVNVLDGRPHGYGYTEGWIPAYTEWLENIFANN